MDEYIYIARISILVLLVALLVVLVMTAWQANRTVKLLNTHINILQGTTEVARARLRCLQSRLKESNGTKGLT